MIGERKNVQTTLTRTHHKHMVFYSILFDSSSTNRMQPQVKPCKAEIVKDKNESSVRRQFTELKSGRNNELGREMGFYDLEWDRNPAYKQC